MPYFSIVVPTRNRAHLLRLALQSASSQSFDDYEILICDNDSRDDTPEVARAFADPRVRYIRTDRSLAMPDNWEFALSHTRGEYVTYLSDDDAVHPRLLETVYDLIREGWPEPIVWTYCRYRHPSSVVDAERNTLIYFPFTGAVREMQSEDALARLFALHDFRHPTPKMMNCVCSRGRIDQVRAEAGRFFEPTSPDYSCAAAMLAVAPRYTYLDMPFWIGGDSPDSIGQSNERSMGNPAGAAFWEEFGDASRWFLHTPLRQPSDTNSIADTLLRVQAALPSRLGRYGLNWARYFGDCYLRIERTRHGGGSVARYVEEFWRELARQPVGVQARVRCEIAGNMALSRLRGRPAEAMRDPLNRARRAVESLLLLAGASGARAAAPRYVGGAAGGFTNIAECAARLDAIWKPVPGAEVPRCRERGAAPRHFGTPARLHPARERSDP